VTFVTIALSPLRSVTRGHERTNSARARSAGEGPVRSRIPLPGLFTKSVDYFTTRMVALGFRALYLFWVTGSSYDLVLVRSLGIGEGPEYRSFSCVKRRSAPALFFFLLCGRFSPTNFWPKSNLSTQWT
jgi:hypothetical protein